MGGGGGGSQSGGYSPYGNYLEAMARNLYETTAGLRKTYITDWENFLTPHQVLRTGAVPTRTPIYGNTAGTSGGGGGMYIDPNTGQVYGGSAVQYFAGSPAGGPAAGSGDYSSQLSQFGPFAPIFDPKTYYGAQEPYYYANVPYPQAPGTAGLSTSDPNYQIPQTYQVKLQPYGGTTGTGGNTITGYNETYAPSDYVTQRFDPYSLPGYSQNYDVARRGLEAQYNTTMGQLIGQIPRGGAMTDALSRLALSRAESVGGLPAAIASPLIQDMLNKSYQSAFMMAPTQATSALGAAEQGYSQRQAAAIAANAAEGGGKGSGLGSLGLGIGSAIGSFFSDKRTKDNIRAVTSLNPVFFDYKPEFGGKDQMGLIADELEQVAPGMVAKGPDGYRRINVMGIVTLLIKAVQEQQKQIDALAGGRIDG